MKISTNKPSNSHSILGKSLATPAIRSDQWLTVLSEGRFWVNGDDSRIDTIRQVLDGLETIERFFAYPGSSVLNKLHSRLNEGDARGFLRAAQNISTSILSQKYMADISAWDNWDADDSQPAERLPQAISHIERKPYFEVLAVVPHITSRWQHIAYEARSIRRPEDEFIYETVVAGNAEDALTAILVNPSITSVVLYEGFAAKAAETNPLITAIAEVIVLCVRDKPSKRFDPSSTSTCSAIARSNILQEILTTKYLADYSIRLKSRLNCTSLSLKACINVITRLSSTISSIMRRGQSQPSMRCPLRAEKRYSSQTGYATWASFTGRTCFSQKALQQRVGSTACWSPLAISRRHRNWQPGLLGRIMFSS